uniref:Uncharacterized protein n=1 Tax=viral metagenome TaxID=1070528 RepID=A0A6C0HLC4_9ZZZZ
MSGGPVKITKVGEHGDTFAKAGLITENTIPIGMPSGPGIAGNNFVASSSSMTGGKRRRTRVATKTFPKGILRRTSRILPSSNPTVPKGAPKGAPKGGKTRKHRLRLSTPKGAEKTRKQVHARASKTDIKTIRAELEKRGIVAKDSKKKIPDGILRTLYADSVGAGLLS